ncbi:hypothetical protein Mro03_51190 [Microbispora rosea subsp. rosea]|nr:hypothetical protein Mro03_51190 [Microbispora rosea subsp. rosea]
MHTRCRRRRTPTRTERRVIKVRVLRRCHPRGALKRELVACLRTGRALRRREIGFTSLHEKLEPLRATLNRLAAISINYEYKNAMLRA